MPGLTCNACNKEFKDDSDQKLYYKSEWHRYNLKRKVAGVPGVTEALFLLFFVLNCIPFNFAATPHDSFIGHEAGRRLLGFKETPSGFNVTFECSPNGPCVPCLYSEKSNPQYRCSETGYRIPFKCEHMKDGAKEANSKKSQGIQSSNGHELQAYITYRSCIPAVNEEKLSVLGFEAIVLGLLLVSSSIVYFRKKQSVSMSATGGLRLPTSSRF